MITPRRLSSFAVSLVLMALMGCVAGNEGGKEVGREDSLPVADGMGNTPPPLSVPRAPVPGQAMLVRGSESVRGIAGFGRNVIPALYGEYALPSANGGMQAVSVWFTREALVLDEGWSPFSCAGLPAGFALAQSGPAEDGLVLLVASTSDYRLVIRLTSDFGSPCRFIAVLLERFMFFMRNATREEDLSFPAFLQL